MSQPIDVAYVELHAKGEQEAARDIKGALNDVSRSVKTTSVAIERELKNAFKDAAQALAKDIPAGAQVADAAIKNLGHDAQHELNGVEHELGQVTAKFITAAAAAKLLDKQIAASHKEMRDLALDFARSGDRAFIGQIDEIKKLTRELEGARKIIGKVADESVGHFRRMFNSVRDGRSVLGSVFSGLEKIGASIGSVFGGAASSIQDAFSKVSSSLSGVGSAISSVATNLTSLITAFPLVSLFIALTPVIIGVGGALLELVGIIGALPAGIFVLIAAIAPLVIAFQGIGGAVSALASGDLKKIDEAMKSLSPSAQAFARELNNLRGPLKDIKLAVQESFFAPLKGVLTEIVRNLLPTLKTGLGAVGSALGGFLAHFGRALALPSTIRTFNAVFKTTADIIKIIGPPLVRLFVTFTAIIQAGLPFIQRFAKALAEGANKLAAFFTASVDNGNFQKFVEGGIRALKSLGTLVVSVTKFLGALFSRGGKDGDNFAVSLAHIIDRMTAFLKSTRGQEGLQRLLDTLPKIITLLSTLIDITSTLTDVSFGFINAVKGAVNILGDFFSAVGSGVVTAYDAVVSFFTAVGDFFVGLHDVVVQGRDAVIGFFGDVVNFVVGLPDQIIGALAALPGQLISFFTDLSGQVAYIVGYGIGLVIQYFIDLPTNIFNALATLGEVVVTLFNDAVNNVVAVVQTAVNVVVYTFTQLPGQIYNAIVSLIGFVSNVFTSARNYAVNAVSNLVSTVINFFSSIPGRAASAVSSLPGRILDILRGIVSGAYNIGKDIIHGVVSGIGDALGSAIDAAKNAARNILRGAKDAIEGHSPSRLFAREIGVPIAQGIGAGIDEGTPTATKALDRLTQDMLPQASSASAQVGVATGGQNIVFNTGAVQVVFQGVVPTEQEAARTGQAVGQSIAATLARRDIRTLVRVT